MQRFLSKEGFCIRAAAGGEEGLRLARQLRPAAITLDVMMPDMDGWSLLSALKADAELCDIPVIMLTMVDDRKRGFTLSASDYATKPVELPPCSQKTGPMFKCCNSRHFLVACVAETRPRS